MGAGADGEKKDELSDEIKLDIDNIFAAFADSQQLVDMKELRTVLRALDVDPLVEEWESLCK